MVEGGTPNTLLRRGLTRDTLEDRHRDHRRWLSDEGPLAEARQRPRRHVHDGQKIFMGSSGTGAPKDGRDPTEAAADQEAGPILKWTPLAPLGEPFHRPAAATVNQRASEATPVSARVARLRSAVRRRCHPPPDRDREDDGGDERRDLQPERLAVIALDRFGEEQRHARQDHERDAAQQQAVPSRAVRLAAAGRGGPAPAGADPRAARRRRARTRPIRCTAFDRREQPQRRPDRTRRARSSHTTRRTAAAFQGTTQPAAQLTNSGCGWMSQSNQL